MEEDDLISATDSSPQANSFDRSALRMLTENDDEFLRELIDTYCMSSPALVAEIKAAADRGDCKTVERASHAMRGAFGTLCASPGSRAAFEVEMMARKGDLSRIHQAIAQLEEESSRLHAAFTEMIKEILA